MDAEALQLAQQTAEETTMQWTLFPPAWTYSADHTPVREPAQFHHSACQPLCSIQP